MKKLLIAAAAVSFVVMTTPMLTQAQAAPKNPYCSLAKSEKNPMSWDQYYGCWNRSARPAQLMNFAPGPLMNRALIRETKSPYCSLAKFEKNPMSWDQYYGCWRG